MRPRRVEHNIGCIFGAAYSPDGRRLATGGHDGSLYIWNTTRYSSVARYDSDLTIVRLAWSANGQRVAIARRQGLDRGSGSVVEIWDVSGSSLDMEGPIHEGAVLDFFWSPDGAHLTSVSEDMVLCVWDAATGKLLRTEAIGDGASETEAAAFSPDGRRLATGDEDTGIKIWDVTTMACRLEDLTGGHTQTVTGLAWSPDGQTLASGASDSVINLWDLGSHPASHRAIPSEGNHYGSVVGLAFSPDGQRLASGGGDGETFVWDVSDPNRPPEWLSEHGRQHGTVSTVAWKPDGSRLVSAGPQDSVARIWFV